MMLKRRRGNGIGDEGQSWQEDQVVIVFGLQPFLHGDFEAMSQSCSNRPTSGFVTSRCVYLRTPGGYLGMKDNTLTEVENGQRRVTQYTDQQIPAVLLERFGLGPCEYQS